MMNRCKRRRIRSRRASAHPLWASAILLAAAQTVGAEENASGSLSFQGVQPRVVMLDNGLKLVLVERHEQPTVAAGVFYSVGSVNDPRGQSGVAHLFEHMLFKGTRVIGTTNYEAERSFMRQQDELREKMIAEMNKMRVMKRKGKINDVLDPAQWTPAYTAMKKQYDELVEAQRAYIVNNELFNLYTTNGGARLNAGTGSDVTLYYVQLPANKLELFFWLEADRMADSTMREFYVERDNVREERRLRVESTPTGRYDEAFDSLFWQAHPYGIPVIGWPSEVESITRDDVREFHKVYYAPNNARIVLVGDFNADEAIEQAKTYFGRHPRGAKAPPPIITEESAPLAHRRLEAEVESNPRVRVRYHTVGAGHVDEAALDMLGGILSGKTGRLYKRLVTQDDAAIGEPGAYNNGQKYAGYFECNITVKEGRDPIEVERIVMEEIDKLRDADVADKELQKVKNQVLAYSVRRLRSNMGLMFQLGLYDVYDDWSYINESPKRMLNVAASDIRRVVKKYFDHDKRTVAVYRTKPPSRSVMPEADDPELTAVLATIPPERQAQFRAAIAGIQKSGDAAVLGQRISLMEQAMTSHPITDEQQRVLDYTLKQMKARLTQLQTGSKE